MLGRESRSPCWRPFAKHCERSTRPSTRGCRKTGLRFRKHRRRQGWGAQCGSKADPVEFVVAGNTEGGAAAGSGTEGDRASPQDARREGEQLQHNERSVGAAGPAVGPGSAGRVPEPARLIGSGWRDTQLCAAACQVVYLLTVYGFLLPLTFDL